MHLQFINMLAAAVGDGESLINILIWLVAVGLICWLLWWLIAFVGLPEPFAKIARVILALVAVIMLIRLIMRFVGPL